VSVAHVIVMVVIAANAVSALLAKKVLLSKHQQTKLKSKRRTRKRPKSVNLVNALNAQNATNVRNVRHVMHLAQKHNQKCHSRKSLQAKACHAFKRSRCSWPTCKPSHKAVAWNGSTPTQNASPLVKQPLQPSLSPCMCHASVHLW